MDRIRSIFFFFFSCVLGGITRKKNHNTSSLLMYHHRSSTSQREGPALSHYYCTVSVYSPYCTRYRFVSEEDTEGHQRNIRLIRKSYFLSLSLSTFLLFFPFFFFFLSIEEQQAPLPFARYVVRLDYWIQSRRRSQLYLDRWRCSRPFVRWILGRCGRR